MTTAAKNIPDVFKRVERKYLLTPAQYEELLDRMSDRVGDDAFPHSLIQSMYYDTPVHGMICRSLEKPVYKEKLRVRAYGYPTPDSPVYVELKKKYDGVVYKRRASMEAGRAMALLRGEKPVILALASHLGAFGGRNVMSLGNDAEDMARALFARLREADELDIDVLFCEAIPASGLGLAVMNRLSRAAGFHVDRAESGEE